MPTPKSKKKAAKKTTASKLGGKKTTKKGSAKSKLSGKKSKGKPNTREKDFGAGRKVIYPTPSVKLHQASSKNGPITEDLAKTMLGWQVLGEDESPGEEYYVFKDMEGSKVVCWNNHKNRPFRLPKCKVLMQEILNKRFKLNMENMIIGRTGLTLNCQHRLTALIFAVQEWRKDDSIWREIWDEEPWIESTIAFGASEMEDVVNTYDTGTSRTLADALYLSGHFGDDLSEAARKKIAKTCESAVKMLWHRTGASNNAFAIYRTHSESLEFIDRHPKILECVREISAWEGSKKDKLISTYLSLGYSSALMYLMASSTSYHADYIADNLRDESALKWDLWEDACDFWHGLASKDKKFAMVKKYLTSLLAEHITVDHKTRMCMLINAWLLFVQGKRITEEGIAVKFDHTDEGRLKIGEYPTCGGIDEGEPGELRAVEVDIDDIKARKDKVDKDRMKKLFGKSKDSKAVTNGEYKEGDKVWVKEANGEHWRGTIKTVEEGIGGKNVGVQPDAGYAGAGNTYTMKMSNVYTERPE